MPDLWAMDLLGSFQERVRGPANGERVRSPGSVLRCLAWAIPPAFGE